jgi:hypothetical protein
VTHTRVVAVRRHRCRGGVRGIEAGGRSWGIRAGSLLAGLTVVTAVVGVGADGAAAATAKPLSVSSITIGGSTAGDFGLTWIAQKAGFFKQQGLTVKIVDFAGSGSTSAITSAFLSGSFDFLNNAASATMYAKQAGAPIQAIVDDDIGQQQEIAISDAAAKRLHVPPTTDTPAGSLAQFKALKGSHITVGITTTASPAYNSIVADAKENGLTTGVNSSSADIDLVTTGTVTSQSSGYLNGKFDAIGSSPPQSLHPDQDDIHLGLVKPASEAAGLYVVGLDSFMKAHPDTTQALVNAEVEAWEYARENPAKAENLITSMEAANDVTNPATVKIIYQGLAEYWKTPLLLQSAFNGAKELSNLSQSTKLTLTYGQWCDPTFVDNAVKDLHLQSEVPTSA